MAKLSVSVVIPTLGRKDELIAVIDYLQQQTVQPLEVIVVDQNVPAIPEVDAKLASWPLVKHLRSPERGVVPNYNRGLFAAQGDLVLFIDDDVIPSPNLIRWHIDNYLDAQVGAVAGRVLQTQGDLPVEEIQTVGRYHRFSGSITMNFNATTAQNVQLAHGCNMSFRRELLVGLDGFDARFDGNGYYFETDGSLRVGSKGYLVRFDPRAELKHLMASRGGARIHDKAVHTFHFMKNGARLFRRHSPMWWLPALVVRSVAYVLAKAAYNLNPAICTQGLRGLWMGLTQ